MERRIGEQNERMLAWRAYLRSQSAVLSVLERELEDETGLPLSQFEVLLYLQRAPEHRLRMQDLARSVLLSKSGITRLVDRMAEAGLVERVPCDSDRRVTWAQITDAGSRSLAGAEPVHLRGIERHFDAFMTEDEAHTISTALLRVFRHAAEQLDSVDRPPPITEEPARA